MSVGQNGRARGPNFLAIVTFASAIGFIALLGVFVFQAMGDGGRAGGSSGPRLAVDRERIDFGRVVYDKTVRAVFTLENIGDQPLQIADRRIAVKLVEGC